MPDEQTTKRSSPNALPDEQRRGVYKAIYGRRDIRSFRPDPIPDDVLARILDAAHHAGSVGFMQPWDFLVIKSAETRTAVRALFERERQAAACFYDEPRRSDYLALKLEGIAETPLNLCVTCDPTRGGEVLRSQQRPRDRCLQHLLRGAESLAGRACRGGRGRLGQHPQDGAPARDPRHPAPRHPRGLPLPRLCRCLPRTPDPRHGELAAASHARRGGGVRVVGATRRADLARPPAGACALPGGGSTGAARSGSSAGHHRRDRAARRGGAGGRARGKTRSPSHPAAPDGWKRSRSAWPGSPARHGPSSTGRRSS